jgi:antitoxin component YwqK of YwqJK toxin-antitoxin module
LKNLLLLVLVFISAKVFAQQDTTIVFTNPGYNKDPLRTNWIPKVEKQDSLWVLTLYNKKKVLQEKISYADEKLEVRKGSYALYENGMLKQEGFYDKGHKHGEWRFYTDYGALEQVKNYTWGILNQKEKR